MKCEVGHLASCSAKYQFHSHFYTSSPGCSDDCTSYAFFFFFTLDDAGLLAISQYSEDPATGHLDTVFFLVSLCLKANAEMVPKIPSCNYMLLM